eukprot:m.14022 g.14022  ORF g.14022 m.14022 type:complete len:469 (+) comp25400_c0_seq3:837-2243(+)
MVEYAYPVTGARTPTSPFTVYSEANILEFLDEMPQPADLATDWSFLTNCAHQQQPTWSGKLPQADFVEEGFPTDQAGLLMGSPTTCTGYLLDENEPRITHQPTLLSNWQRPRDNDILKGSLSSIPDTDGYSESPTSTQNDIDPTWPLPVEAAAPPWTDSRGYSFDHGFYPLQARKVQVPYLREPPPLTPLHECEGGGERRGGGGGPLTKIKLENDADSFPHPPQPEPTRRWENRQPAIAAAAEVNADEEITAPQPATAAPAKTIGRKAVLVSKPYILRSHSARGNDGNGCGSEATDASIVSATASDGLSDDEQNDSDDSAEQYCPGLEKIRGFKDIGGRPIHSAHSPQLWEFLLMLLDDLKKKNVIGWKSKEDGVFKIFSSDAAARLWGSHKNRTNMNYDKMSRAMRYYYAKGIFEKVPGRLVYKFSKSARQRYAATKQSAAAAAAPTNGIHFSVPSRRYGRRTETKS